MLARSFFFVASSIVSLSLVACSSPPAGEEVAEDSADQTAPMCTPGKAFRSPGFEEEIGVVASARAPYVKTGVLIGKDLFADATKDPVTLLALGSGERAGNVQRIADEDWRHCGGAIVVAPKAHAVFGGGGLTAAQLEGCAEDLTRPECATIAHYCEPRSFELPPGAAPRCLLKEGIAIDATVHGGPACIPGAAFPRPAFDDELETVVQAKAAHDATGYVLSRDVPAGDDIRATVIAAGSGALAGNFQLVSTQAWEVCGSQLRVFPRAQIEFLGGGLTREQLEECAADLTAAHCATIAHYCDAGSFSLPSQAAPRCRLREGIEVQATFSRRK
ncbi:MAG: hypothetical protein KIT84_41975 [Labilithrix sp.]|nr:hypothetical protein [Labilithrix sp.]MCW5817643.1 hypothetical protein [Labilithrix sp.]